MKLNGAEFKAWYASEWGEGAYIDNYEITINDGEPAEDFDEEAIADTDVIEVHCGVMYLDEEGTKSMDMLKHIRKWQKAQTQQEVVVTVDNARLAEFKALIKGFKGASIRKD